MCIDIGRKSLEEHDPEMFDIIEKEKHRQWTGLELIASENLTSRAVMECLGMLKEFDTIFFFFFFFFSIHQIN